MLDLATTFAAVLLHQAAGADVCGQGDRYTIRAQGPATGSTAKLPERLRKALEARDRLTDKAADDVAFELEALADALAKHIIEIATSDGGGDFRAGVLRYQLEQIVEDLNASGGLSVVRDEWVKALASVENATPEVLRAMGIVDRATSDNDILSAADEPINSAFRDAGDLFDAQVTAMAKAAHTGLQEAYRLEKLEERTHRLKESLDISIGQATTEVRTRSAVFARTVQHEASTEGRDTKGLVWAYTGPVDGIERPFCQHLTGCALDLEIAKDLDNGVPQLGHPFDAGGGYNCRHQGLVVRASIAEQMGYDVLLGADAKARVVIANIAARSRR